MGGGHGFSPHIHMQEEVAAACLLGLFDGQEEGDAPCLQAQKEAGLDR